MGQVTVTLNARTYRLRCGDGEETKLAELATYVSQRIDALSSQFGQHGDERLLLMAALLITEEMLDLKQQVQGLAATSGKLADPVETEGEPASPEAPASSASAQSPLATPIATSRRPSEASARQPLSSRTSLEARLLQARGERP